jgi:hypothetical protein
VVTLCGGRDSAGPCGRQGPRPYVETLGATLRRTLTIAFVITTVLAVVLPHEHSFSGFWLRTYPAVLWFPLGGHYVELTYLNVLRMRWWWFHRHRYVARVLWWFVGGLPLGLGCWWTWIGLGADLGFELPLWWGMPFFVLAECAVHAILSVLGRPSFWNGRE